MVGVSVRYGVLTFKRALSRLLGTLYLELHEDVDNVYECTTLFVRQISTLLLCFCLSTHHTKICERRLQPQSICSHLAHVGNNA